MRQIRLVRSWLAAIGVVAVLVLGFTVLPQLVSERPEPTDVAPAPAASGPPDFDLVLRLRDELAATAANNPDYPIDPAQAALVATSPGEYTPLGRISSPGIGLDAEYAAGVHPSVLDRGPGHWPGTAAPGQAGNAVISGHRTTQTRPFRDLDVLVPGDPVTVAASGTAPVTYRVTETAIVSEAEYTEFVLRPPADAAARQLTLFACHPKGERTQRIVVRAVAEAGEGR